MLQPSVPIFQTGCPEYLEETTDKINIYHWTIKLWLYVYGTMQKKVYKVFTVGLQSFLKDARSQSYNKIMVLSSVH